MFRQLGPVWVIVVTILAGVPARAQMPFPTNLVPARTTLERLGLERQWFGVIPLVETERLLRISLAEGILFAQTNYARLHSFDAESGRHLWSAQFGERSGFARGVAANSFAVFVTNANILHALDKKTGRPIWTYNLGTIPTCTPACDEDRVIVGLTSGKLIAFALKKKDPKGVTEHILTSVTPEWSWQTAGPILTRPLPALHVVAYAGGKGAAYVAMTEEVTELYRFPTGGLIGEGLGAYGSRTLLIPSADYNLYAVDLLTARLFWLFPSGAPIEQEPLVADHDIFVANTAGNLSRLNPVTGTPRWTVSTQGGQLVAISATRVYLRSYNLDLFVIDRATGKTLADPGETHVRAGLNLRDYDLNVVNRFNDRMYFATPSGMIIALREPGQLQPRLLHNPKAVPFGYVPPEGLKGPPPETPAAEPPTTDGVTPPASDAAAPGGEPAAADAKKDEKEKNATPKDQEKEPEADAPKL
jgi:outer membrane protein assembly factor BamB